MKKSLEFTFLIGGILAIAVIMISIFVIYSIGGRGGPVSKADILSACDLSCLEDSRRYFESNEEGICVLEGGEFSFLSRSFKVEGKEVYCPDITTCRIRDRYGRYCLVEFLNGEEGS